MCDVASIGDTSDGRHRATAEQRPPRPRRRRRDDLGTDHALGAVWYTRRACALTNVTYGAGFILGAPTGSSTYQAMAEIMPMSWWGALLVVFGPLLLLGRIALGAPVTAAVWLCFAIFNARSTAWGVPVFALPAILHLGMFWYILRGRATRADRAGRTRASR